VASSGRVVAAGTYFRDKLSAVNYRVPTAGLVLLFLLIPWSAACGESARAVAESAFRSVVLVRMEDSNGRPIAMGSGFFVREDLVVTNYHVVNGASRGYVKLVGENNSYEIAGTVSRDQKKDLAVLKKLGAKAPSLRLGSDVDVRVGDRIFVVGNPLGLEGTFSDGIVSGVRRSPSLRLLQITAPISPGSSGGPVLAENGSVIGIAVASLREGQNLNFAIPVSELPPLLANTVTVSALPGAQAKAKSTPRVPDSGRKKVEADTPPSTRDRPDTAVSASAQAMRKYRNGLLPVIQMYERELARQTELAEIRQELYERGVLSKQDVDHGRRDLAKAQKDVNDVRRQLVEVDRLIAEFGEGSK
jgi:S1-C subfamily serine protease